MHPKALEWPAHLDRVGGQVLPTGGFKTGFHGRIMSISVSSAN